MSIVLISFALVMKPIIVVCLIIILHTRATYFVFYFLALPYIGFKSDFLFWLLGDINLFKLGKICSAKEA